ncbi:MAG: tautomerase family protein [Leptolyngbyaceae cyanobacterium bins.349]|nr:tautomerase family protein [Leptolyngbyaceae cyanobacterium bins.349]
MALNFVQQSTEGEKTMPHISIKLYPGRSEQQKVRLAEQIVKDVISLLESSEDSISVAIEEINPEDWVEKVYKPEILSNPDKLYKKPGCNPLG